MIVGVDNCPDRQPVTVSNGQLVNGQTQSNLGGERKAMPDAKSVANDATELPFLSLRLCLSHKELPLYSPPWELTL